MDVEFHYYVTYLIAARAGFSPKDALTIAHASQYVDDNDVVIEVDKGKPETRFRNYVSQTVNILKPGDQLMRIYPLFHFIPGEPMAESARRKDGRMHWLNTTPNSPNANAIIDAAIASGSLYRIGIAAHSYVDTWAHQNFVGHYEDFNAIQGKGYSPNVGHADAGHSPDWPSLQWEDPRLKVPEIDNRVRFLDAAEHLLAKLAPLGEGSDADLPARQASLRQDLKFIFGSVDMDNSDKSIRIQRYKALARLEQYGGTALPEYDEELWLNQAVDGDVRGLKDARFGALAELLPFKDSYSWKNRQTYRQSSWYQFQQAVIDHQNAAWEIMAGNNFLGVELAL